MDGTIYKKHYMTQDSAPVIIPASAVLVEVIRESDRLLIATIMTNTAGSFEFDPQTTIKYILSVHGEEFYAYGNSSGLELYIKDYEDDYDIEVVPPTVPEGYLPPAGPNVNPTLWRDAYFCGSNAQVKIDALEWSPLPITIAQWAANYGQSPLYSHTASFFDTVMEGQYLVEGGMGLTMQQALEMQRNLKTKRITPLAHNAFNMRIEYVLDFPGTRKIETYHFESVHLTAISHVVTPDGEPVGENYEFFARRVQKYDSKADLIT